MSEYVLEIFSADGIPGFSWGRQEDLNQASSVARGFCKPTHFTCATFNPTDEIDKAPQCCFRILRLFSAVDGRSARPEDPKLIQSLRIVFEQFTQKGVLDDAGEVAYSDLQTFIRMLDDQHQDSTFASGVQWLVEEGKKVHGSQA